MKNKKLVYLFCCTKYFLAVLGLAAQFGIVAQNYRNHSPFDLQNYSSPTAIYQLSNDNDLRKLPDGYYTLTNADRKENGSFLHIAKKGEYFLAAGLLNGIAELPNDGVYSLKCAKGRLKNSRLLFDEIINLKKDYDDDLYKNFTFDKHVDLPEINTKEFLTVVEQKTLLQIGEKRYFGVCNDFLPLISNRLRVVDPETNEYWNLSGLLDGSKISVLPVGAAQSEAVMEMPVETKNTNEFYNGRYSSLKTLKGNKENLVNDKQYFLRATLDYPDTISVSNEHTYLTQTEGCPAPIGGKITRTVIRDGKPFTVKKGYLNELIEDIFPWRARHKTSQPAGKAAFDRDVDKYYQNIDDEIQRILSQPTNIDFPPPVILLHGILSCWKDWEETWTKPLLNRQLPGPGAPLAGIITFTPTYEYWVKAQWKTIPELKNLRDKMALSVSEQIQNDIDPLFLSDSNGSAPPVYLITHSNGGVVARPLSKIANSSWRIKKIYTLGAPHSGTFVLFASDFGLNASAMARYNCLEKGFNPNVDVAAIAGNGSANWKPGPNDRTVKTPFIKSYLLALGNEKFNDGAVYPHGSTNIIVCENPDGTFSEIERIRLLGIFPLYHSLTVSKLNFNDKGNFLDQQGYKLFENIIANDAGLR